MEPVAKAAYRSKTVVTMRNSLNWDISALNKFLQTSGMRIANGYGKLKDISYRVATMGETTMEDVDTLLAAMDEFIKQG